MSRNLLSLGVLAAAFAVVIGTTDAQARSCRSHRQQNCCQNGNYDYRNSGYQQTGNYGYQQATYATANTCCNPRPTCYSAQPACANVASPANFSPSPSPSPSPSFNEQTAPAPAPGTCSM